MTAAPVRAAGRRRTLPARGEIPALDGIRAIAVLLVLAGHAGVPGVAGGFIGVDIFFVLSGFLITSLLLDEFARTGRVDLKGFWIRRARRLLPALLVMTLAVVAARELFPPDAVTSLRDDAVAAFFWVANWAFVAQQADYFSQGARRRPCSTPGHSGSKSSTTSSGRSWCCSPCSCCAGAGPAPCASRWS